MHPWPAVISAIVCTVGRPLILYASQFTGLPSSLVLEHRTNTKIPNIHKIIVKKIYHMDQKFGDMVYIDDNPYRILFCFCIAEMRQ